MTGTGAVVNERKRRMQKPKSYLVNAALACGVLYYVLDLSAAGRTAIDYAVIGLVALAILWNLVQLGRRLYRGAGGRAVWHLQRTVLFWIIGLFNTLLIRPEHVGGWRHWLGWIMVAVAVADSIVLFLRERRIVQSDGVAG
jgi:xanthosine utilization system XapX-like protein